MENPEKSMEYMTFVILLAELLLMYLLAALWRVYRRNRRVYRLKDKYRMASLKEHVTYLYRILGTRGSHFKCPPELQSAIRHRNNLEYNLRRLMREILDHMGLSIEGPELHIVYSNFDSFSRDGTAGRFETGGGRRSEIEIFLKKDYSFWNTAAVLCHECAHYFMNLRNIRLQDPAEQEELTDITAVFLGFGKILRRGYEQRSRSKPMGFNQKLIQQTRLGYLSADEIGYVQVSLENRVPKYRNVFYGRSRSAEQPPPRENKYRKITARIETLEKKHNALVRLIARPELAAASYTRKEWELLQELMIALETGHLEASLGGLKRQAPTTDPKELSASLALVVDLEKRIAAWTALAKRKVGH